ncbi:ornithine cyclodeaminase family protein [Kitasatospora viridis]|nr:ornithine cyclodeaminase family protein [Kitasatospora viridis]
MTTSVNEPLLLSDADVRAHLSAERTVAAIRSALVEHHQGTLHAPARAHAELGDGALVFTVGRLAGQGVFGFRAYDTFVGAEQLVALWSEQDASLRAVVHGRELGNRRTGAIGAVAADLLAKPGPVRVGLFGTGLQAWTQLWALTAVRPVTEVLVQSRNPANAEAFAARARAELGVEIRPAGSPEEAARERDVVITATNSSTPVLEAEWLAPGTHLTTLGPKFAQHHEIPVELAERGEVFCTDSLAQLNGYPDPHLFAGKPMAQLGALAAGDAPGRTSADQVTVFCSVGLAGTEVAVAAALVEALG